MKKHHKTKNKMAEQEKIKSRIEKMINQENNQEKQRMLNSVLINNLGYAKGRQDLLRLGNIIDVMKEVDRRFFAPLHEAIYIDAPLAIGYGQTISQPTTVARMLLLAKLKQGMDVLEIGAGSGWNASLASKIVSPAKVTAIERIAPILSLAKKNFENFEKNKHERLNAEFVFADALDEKNKFWKKKYDRIIVTAGADKDLERKLQHMGKKLLKDNGLLLYPTSDHGYDGALELWKNKKGKLTRVLREQGYAFVPLLKGEEE